MPRKTLKKRADGRYMAQITIGHDAMGKRIVKTVYGSTQKEVTAKADAIRAQKRQGVDLEAQRETFSELFDRYIASKSLSHASELNEKGMAAFAVERLGHKPITSLRTSDFQAVANELAADGARKKSTIRQMVGAWRRIMQFAVDDRILPYNCVAAVTVPATAAPTHRREALTDEQIAWILDTPHDLQIPCLIMLYCGLRLGEVLALHKADIDFEKKVLHVTRSLAPKEADIVERDKTKTDAGKRVVPVPDFLLCLLAELPGDVICVTSRGSRMKYRSWQLRWESYMDFLNAKYGGFSDEELRGKNLPLRIKPFTAHCLRHTYATLLYESGVDVLSAMSFLGHSDASTTMRIYTHLRQTQAAQSGEKYTNFLENKGVKIGESVK